tara:strand:+ start:1819 stop:1956 length:138 start_codon:yes stop_codon:yes gene_type:complete
MAKEKKDEDNFISNINNMLVSNGLPKFGTKEFNDICFNSFGGSKL